MEDKITEMSQEEKGIYCPSFTFNVRGELITIAQTKEYPWYDSSLDELPEDTSIWAVDVSVHAHAFKDKREIPMNEDSFDGEIKLWEVTYGKRGFNIARVAERTTKDIDYVIWKYSESAIEYRDPNNPIKMLLHPCTKEYLDGFVSTFGDKIRLDSPQNDSYKLLDFKDNTLGIDEVVSDPKKDTHRLRSLKPRIPSEEELKYRKEVEVQDKMYSLIDTALDYLSRDLGYDGEVELSRRYGYLALVELKQIIEYDIPSLRKARFKYDLARMR